MTDSTQGGRKIIWIHVLTVVSAAILIGAEVFGAAFAGGWAVANMVGLGGDWVLILQGVFFLLGVYVMIQFIRSAQIIEPFTARE
jgi:fatty acid desaturase